MNAVDPSEAIRSTEILRLLPLFFDIIEIRGYGGSILNLLLDDIAGNFVENDERSIEYLRSFFELEDRLIASGDLSHDFAVIVARPKPVSEELLVRALENSVEWHQEHAVFESATRLEGMAKALESAAKGLDWSLGCIAEMEKTIASHETALAWRAKQVDELEASVDAAHSSLESTTRQLAVVTEQLEAIHSSPSWKFILRICRLRNRLLPPGSARCKIFDRLIGP
jgi:hypothetical protein